MKKTENISNIMDLENVLNKFIDEIIGDLCDIDDRSYDYCDRCELELYDEDQCNAIQRAKTRSLELIKSLQAMGLDVKCTPKSDESSLKITEHKCG